MEEFKDSTIDKTQRAGTGPKEKISVWNKWSLRHTSELRLAKEAKLLGPEGKVSRNVVEHLLVVNALANFIAREASRAGLSINSDVVDKASILHDISKRLDEEKGIGYQQKSSIMAELLEKAGYNDTVIETAQYTGRVDGMFMEEPISQQEDIVKKSLEALIVAYSDARVRNTDIVSLEQARDLNKQKVPKDATIYDRWYAFYKQVEERIFSDLRIKPGDVTNEVVFDYISE